MSNKDNNTAEKKQIIPIIELDINDFDPLGFVNSLGISRLITIDQGGNTKFYIPENYSEESFSDLKRIVKVIKTLFGEIDPWIIIRINVKVLLLMKIKRKDNIFYAIAEIYNDKLADVLDIFVKSIKDIILSKIE